MTPIYIIFLMKFTTLASVSTGDISELLTKRTSKLWLLNETQLRFPENPYCSICCVDINQSYRGRKCNIHTMCVYERKPVGAACNGLIEMKLSRDEIDAIVDAHNTIRNRIALGQQSHHPDTPSAPRPTASNMRIISWDKELESLAARWATQCVFLHDKCRDLSRFPVGQNMAKAGYASKNNLEHIVDWYERGELVEAEALKSYNPKTSGEFYQYTQLIWADTYLIGCARAAFQKQVDGQIVYMEHFFCNYGPSGNIPHQPVYKFGEACSGCLDGTFCTNPEYPGLCGNEVLNETYLRNLKRKRAKEMGADNGSARALRDVSNCCLYSVICLMLLLYKG